MKMKHSGFKPWGNNFSFVVSCLLRFVNGYEMQNLCCFRGHHMLLNVFDIFCLSWEPGGVCFLIWYPKFLGVEFCVADFLYRPNESILQFSCRISAGDIWPLSVFPDLSYLFLHWIRKFSLIVNVTLVDCDWYRHLSPLPNYKMIGTLLRLKYHKYSLYVADC
jgi:hypothetical protein